MALSPEQEMGGGVREPFVFKRSLISGSGTGTGTMCLRCCFSGIPTPAELCRAEAHCASLKPLNVLLLFEGASLTNHVSAPRAPPLTGTIEFSLHSRGMPNSSGLAMEKIYGWSASTDSHDCC